MTEAESWLAQRPASAQAPAPLHIEYIRGSRSAIVKWRAWLVFAGVSAALAVAAIVVLRYDAEVREDSSALLDSATRAATLVNSPRQREGLVTAVSAGRRSEQLFGRVIPGVFAPLLDALARAREVLRVDDPGRQPRDMRASDSGEVLLLYRRDQDDVGVSELIGATWTFGATPKRTEIKAGRRSDDVALCPRGSCYLVGQGGRMAVLDPRGSTLWPDLEKAMAADLDPSAGILYRVTAAGSLVRRGRGRNDRDKVLRTGFQDAESVQVSRNGQSVLVLARQGAHLLDTKTGRWSDFSVASCQSRASMSADGLSVLCAARQGAVARFTTTSREPETIASHGLTTVGTLVTGPLAGQYAIASSYGGSLAVFRDGERTAGPFYGGEASRIAFLPDGMHIVEIGWLDRQLKLFELGAQPLRAEIHPFGTDLTRITSCGPGRWAVGAFDGRVGMFGESIKPVLWAAHDGQVNRIACLSDGRIMSAGDDGGLLLTSDGHTTTLTSGSEQKFRTFDLLPGGQELLATDGKDVWRVRLDGTRKFLFKSNLEYVWRLAVDSRTGLVFLGSPGGGTVEVRRFDGAVVTAPYRAHFGAVNSLAPLWTGREIVTGGTLGTTDMMSLSKRRLDGRLETTANAHTAMTKDLAVDDDARLIVSAGDDGQVQFWDENLAKVGPPILRTGAFVASVALSRDRELAAVSGKEVYTVRYGPGDLFAQACRRLLGRSPDACSGRSPDPACGACPAASGASKASEAGAGP
ncbi:WD40 repeat domain-containing protein [Methylobacterium frigidaeris]|uniref:WD40 repeat domain-containing protein n=1 Tax=Methylobacterium frigidaeris TaxID=2038277 RepID=A0AA37HKC4_9HYPH|nr:WD40 repeat domain-containing protein [Methylobacterium frigidaeris]GJD66720.1 hypothetical protein MPEAHAMD_6918 [Methylobacterium frigidaeris]